MEGVWVEGLDIGSGFVFVRLLRVVVDDALDGVFLVLVLRLVGFRTSEFVGRTPDCERVMAMRSDLSYSLRRTTGQKLRRSTCQWHSPETPRDSNAEARADHAGLLAGLQ